MNNSYLDRVTCVSVQSHNVCLQDRSAPKNNIFNSKEKTNLTKAKKTKLKIKKAFIQSQGKTDLIKAEKTTQIMSACGTGVSKKEEKEEKNKDNISCKENYHIKRKRNKRKKHMRKQGKDPIM